MHHRLQLCSRKLLCLDTLTAIQFSDEIMMHWIIWGGRRGMKGRRKCVYYLLFPVVLLLPSPPLQCQFHTLDKTSPPTLATTQDVLNPSHGKSEDVRRVGRLWAWWEHRKHLLWRGNSQCQHCLFYQFFRSKIHKVSEAKITDKIGRRL